MVRFKVTHPEGPISGRVRLGETDKETRGSNRKSVTILPARRTIVNVYQLLNKLSTSTGIKKKQSPVGRPPSGKQTSKEKSEMFAGEQEIKRRTRRSKTHFFDQDVLWKTIDGTQVNTFKLPFKKPGEIQSEYNPRAYEFVRIQKNNKNPDYADFKFEETVTDIVNEQRPQSHVREPQVNVGKDITTAKAEADAARRSIRYDETTDTGKINVLGSIVRGEGIPTQRKVVNDPAYTDYNPVEDFERVKRAIMVAKAENKIKGPNPAVIAIKKDERSQPTTYYIRNDLSYRRKKHVKPTLKRRIIKKSSSDIKRKVIMKKKGGKR